MINEFEIECDNNMPPTNNKPPSIPPNMSPDQYYLEMLDIIYKNYTYSPISEILDHNNNNDNIE